MYSPRSCDTFAVLPPGTAENCVVFGKNSDRPREEMQEVVYVPASDFAVPCSLKCTYIAVDQVSHTYATILSKPSWMWGAEMGANEHGVCIGNEAVWTKLNDESDSDKKLLGMDLLRLGLERAKTALEALHVIVSLIDKYRMGGNCSDTIPDFTYHNSFLIADPVEVWILECAGKIWAAEQVTGGVRNISNELSIGTKMDLKCENLEEYAKENGFWNSERGPLNFKLAFGLGGDELDEFESYRYKCGKSLLKQFSSNGQFKESDMFKVLRDKQSDICMSSGSFITTGSQVSILRKAESGLVSCHWFTATPDPSRSVFKPFIFTDQIEFPHAVVSPISESSQIVDRKHLLYKAQQQFSKNPKISVGMLRYNISDMEDKYIQYVKEVINNIDSKNGDASTLFKTAVEDEFKMYELND